MQLGLRTKLTLVMTGLVFLVVVVLSAVFVSRLTSQVIHETNTRANELAQQIFEQAKHAWKTPNKRVSGPFRTVQKTATLM